MNSSFHRPETEPFPEKRKKEKREKNGGFFLDGRIEGDMRRVEENGKKMDIGHGYPGPGIGG